MNSKRHIIVVCPAEDFESFMQIRFLAMRLTNCSGNDSVDVLVAAAPVYGTNLLKNTRGIVFAGRSPKEGFADAMKDYAAARKKHGYRFRITRMIDSHLDDQFTKDELLAADTVITHSRASAESLMKTADIGNKLDVWVTPWRIPGFLTGMEEPVSQDHEVPTVLVIGNLSGKVENEVYDALTKDSRSVNVATINCSNDKLMRLNSANCANFGDTHPLAFFHVVSAMHPDFILTEDDTVVAAAVSECVPVVSSMSNLLNMFYDRQYYKGLKEEAVRKLGTEDVLIDAPAQNEFIAVATETD